MENKLDFGTVLKEGLEYGTKNIPSLLGALILWVLTIWIPYVNVGTTIAISTLPIQLSKGTVFSPLSIFDKKYYRFIGEYFLTIGLMYIGIIGAALFLIVPGIVVSIAWSLSILLVLDKGLNAAEAIRLSNKLTYGNKWTIFFVNAVLAIAYFVAYFILLIILIKIPYLGVILILCLTVVYLAATIGMQASIYGKLSKGIETES
jgi:hypothetical protein